MQFKTPDWLPQQDPSCKVLSGGRAMSQSPTNILLTLRCQFPMHILSKTYSPIRSCPGTYSKIAPTTAPLLATGDTAPSTPGQVLGQAPSEPGPTNGSATTQQQQPFI